MYPEFYWFYKFHETLLDLSSYDRDDRHGNSVPYSSVASASDFEWPTRVTRVTLMWYPVYVAHAVPRV